MTRTVKVTICMGLAILTIGGVANRMLGRDRCFFYRMHCISDSGISIRLNIV
jgi:hypothetical protein